jgi:hypothetical protein
MPACMHHTPDLDDLVRFANRFAKPSAGSPPFSASRPEPSGGRRVLWCRANNDGIDVMLVAAVVTEKGADPGEHFRDRAAALGAGVFR